MFTDVYACYSVLHKIVSQEFICFHFSCIVESRAFHNKQADDDNPVMYGVIQPSSEEVI